MKIIRPAHTEYHEELNLEYRFRNDPEAGFAFPWKDGKVVLNNLSEKNFMWCLEHPEEVESLGVVTRKSSCSVPALARCECGEEFFLEDRYYGCCQCPGCGRWYAIAGYEVNPPDEWEEDLEEDEWQSGAYGIRLVVNSVEK